MSRLKDIIQSICIKYPHKTELSKARLTKLVYLSDWFASLVKDEPLTEVKWLFNHHGPYVDDIYEAISKDENFKIVETTNYYGSKKHLIMYSSNNQEKSTLDSFEQKILDNVIEKTKTMYFSDFIDYVYSTYPVASSERYSKLDLKKLAKQYKSEKKKNEGNNQSVAPA